MKNKTVKVLQPQLPEIEMRKRFINLPKSNRILATSVKIRDVETSRFIISAFFIDSEGVFEGFMSPSEEDGILKYKKFKVAESEVLEDYFCFFNTLEEAEELLVTKNTSNSNFGHIYQAVIANEVLTLKFIVGWQGSKDEKEKIDITSSYYFNKFDRKWERITKKMRDKFL